MYFSIEFNDETSIKKIKIIDISGRIIFEKNSDLRNITIPNPQNGIYFIEIQTQNNTYFEKIIIEQ